MRLLESERSRPDESLILGRLSRESVPDEGDLRDHSLPHFALSLTGAHDFEHFGLGDRLHLGNRNGVLAGLLLALLFDRIGEDLHQSGQTHMGRGRQDRTAMTN